MTATDDPKTTTADDEADMEQTDKRPGNPAVLAESSPSTRLPILKLIGVVALGGAVVAAAFWFLRGGTLQSRLLVGGIVALLVGVTGLRYVARIAILQRTRYVITERSLRREFAFLFRRDEREVPIKKVRGLKLSQTPLQGLLGYADVDVLTTAPDTSIGFLSFEQLEDATTQRDTIRDLIEADD